MAKGLKSGGKFGNSTGGVTPSAGATKTYEARPVQTTATYQNKNVDTAEKADMYGTTVRPSQAAAPSSNFRSENQKQKPKEKADSSPTMLEEANASSRIQALKRMVSKEGEPQKNGVKGGWVLFWLVAGIAIGADIIDIFTTLLDIIGLGLQVIPIIGNAAGIAIGFVSQSIDLAIGMFVGFTMLAYFAYIGGSFGRRLVVMSIGAIMELIPFVDILPLTTLMFFIAFFIGRIKIIKTIASLTPMGKKILRT